MNHNQFLEHIKDDIRHLIDHFYAKNKAKCDKALAQIQTLEKQSIPNNSFNQLAWQKTNNKMKELHAIIKQDDYKDAIMQLEMLRDNLLYYGSTDDYKFIIKIIPVCNEIFKTLKELQARNLIDESCISEFYDTLYKNFKTYVCSTTDEAAEVGLITLYHFKDAMLKGNLTPIHEYIARKIIRDEAIATYQTTLWYIQTNPSGANNLKNLSVLISSLLQEIIIPATEYWQKIEELNDTKAQLQNIINDVNEEFIKLKDNLVLESPANIKARFFTKNNPNIVDAETQLAKAIVPCFINNNR